MEIIFSVLADALVTIALQNFMQRPRWDKLREHLQGKSAEQYSLQRAFARAYMIFAAEYPELAASLFDESFLNQEIVKKELSKVLTPDQVPNIGLISDAWCKQFAIPPEFDPLPPIKFLVDTVQSEVKASPVLKPFTDSRALDQLYSIAESTDQQVRIQEDVRKILEDIRDFVTKANQLQNGIVISQISEANDPQRVHLALSSSEREFIDHWLEVAKQTTEFKESHFQNQYRAAMLLYTRTGLPQELTDMESAGKLIELVLALHMFITDSRNENYATVLEWGYQTMKAAQNWSAIHNMAWRVSAKMVDDKDPQALKWIDRIEALRPKWYERIGPRVKDFDQIMMHNQLHVHDLRGQCLLDSDLEKAVEYFEKANELLDEISDEVLPLGNREFYAGNIAFAFKAMVEKECDVAAELRRKNRFDEALQHYQVADEYARRSKDNIYIVVVMIQIALVYEKRNQEGDFEKVQDVLGDAYSIVTFLEETQAVARLIAVIMSSWGRSVMLMENASEDDALLEKLKKNLVYDHKKTALFSIKKLTTALEYAVKAKDETIVAEVHFFLAQANYILEEKKKALQHIEIAIDLFEKQKNLYDHKTALNLREKYRKSMTLLGF